MNGQGDIEDARQAMTVMKDVKAAGERFLQGMASEEAENRTFIYAKMPLLRSSKSAG